MTKRLRIRILPRTPWLRRIVGFIYGAGIALLLLAAGFAVRLAAGPIELDFAIDRFEQSLTPADNSFRIEIESAVLDWEGWGRGLKIRAQGVALHHADGTRFASLPSLSFSLDPWRLIGGDLAPNRIVVRAPELAMIRSADGRISLGLAANRDRERGFVPGLLGALAGDDPAEGSMRTLTEVSVEDGTLRIRDAAMGRTWHAERLSARVWRDGAEVRGELSFTLTIEGQRIDLRASLDHRLNSGATGARVVFTGVNPEVFESAEGPMQAFGWFRMPLDGAALIAVAPDRRVTGLGFELTGQSGRIAIPQSFRRPLSVRSFRATARLSDDGSELTLGPMRIDFGGPTLTLTGTASQGDAGSRFAGRAVFTDLPIDEIGTYWPRNLAGNARRWVSENIGEGMVPELAVDVRLSIGSGEDAPIDIEEIDGRFSYEGMSIRYIRGLPPVTDITGTSRIGENGMTFAVTRGALGGIRVTGANAQITGFDQDPAWMDLNVQIAGPLSEILGVIDQPPLGYATEIGANPNLVEGESVATLRARYPLLGELPLNRVDIDVRATLRQVIWRRGLFGRDVTDGQFDLRLDKDGMTVAGPAQFNGAPIGLEWRENFAEEAPVRRVLGLTGDMTPELLAAFDLDLAGIFTGAAPMRLRATGRRDGVNELEASFELENTRIRLPFLNAEKPMGQAGTAQVTMLLDGERPREIPNLEIDSEALALEARAAFLEDGMTFSEVVINRLRTGRTDAAGRIDRSADGAQVVTLRGESFDMAPLLQDTDDEPTEDAPPVALTVNAEVERLYLGEGPPLHDVTLAARHDGTYLRALSLLGRPAGGAPLTVSLSEQEGGQQFRLHALNAGALAAALGITDNMRNGDLTITATRERVDEGVPFIGRMELTSFALVEVPELSRLILFDGQQSQAAEPDRVEFEQFISPFRFSAGVLDVRNGRANGSQIGLTFSGRIDLGSETMVLQGTAVPAYRLNSLLGRIPGVGRIIVGEEGSGVLAVRWRAEGSFDDPELEVNALSVLTPGFTRYLLDVFRGERDDETDFDAADDYFDIGP